MTSEADTAVDTAMHDATQPALPQAAQAAAANDGAAKERDKPSEPEANGASSVSFTEPIPAEKLRVAAATALSAAAVAIPPHALWQYAVHMNVHREIVEALTGAGHCWQAIGY